MALNVSFEGKRVLVTGGANGLGKYLVQKFYEDRATVYTLDRDEAALKALKAEFPNIKTAVVDLCDWEATKKVVSSFGPVDHLVNNAGILINQEFLDLTEDAVDKQVSVNYKAIINVSQVVAKKMIENNIAGSILNMSSIAAKVNVPGISVYSCTKAIIVMLTKSMALELGPHNIRVNCICPTGFDTQLLRLLPPAAGATMARAVIKRPAEISEPADLIFFLLSDRAGMITGEDVNMDGGLMTC